MKLSHLDLLQSRSFGKNKLSPASQYSGRLPALRKLLGSASNTTKTRSVLITHILHTAVEYVEAVNSIYPVAGIVAIPYSADPAAISELRSKGYNVILPTSVPEIFTKSHEVTIAALKAKGDPLIVQEVGGYLAKHTNELASYQNFVGIVEDTNNGHWLYEQTNPHPCPVLSMAQSPLKDVEDTIIGDAVIFSVERVLRESFTGIFQGARCGVIGFGKIGSSCAVAMKGREGVVSVYDINPAKDMRAKVEGFFPLPLHDLLPESEVIIGATGQTCIRLVDMPHIRDGAVLASASSKRVEFAIDDFAKNCEVEKIDEVVTKYTQKDGKVFYILNDGTPINFRDKSILGAILDMIYCELFVCMRDVADRKISAGLQHSAPEIQNEVAKAWLAEHSPDFHAYKDEKVWDYPDSLDIGRPKP